jgi:PncC family amidohydrolase
MQVVNASIVTIGDELLIGQTIDTNSAFIAQELNKIGIWVRRRVAVGDVWDEIWNALDEESQESEVIIITGGLGPTADDITKPLLCKYFGGKLVLNEKVLEHVKYLFEKVYRRPGPLLERNIKQAEVPDVCTVLHNSRGTAPGMWFGPRRKASPSPSKGGVSESDNSESHYNYLTADPIVYGTLKNFVAEHRSNSTEAEKILWEIVRGKKLSGYKFRRQHIILNYIADFVCLPENLIIEVDGLYHQLPENKITDKERTKRLNETGFDVLRFTNEEVIHHTDTVVNKILEQLNKKKTETRTTQDPPSGGGGTIFISLPGVPYEMKGLMIDEVIPKLKQSFTLPAIVHKTLFTAGQGESFIADKIKDWEESLPENIKLAYLPGYGMVKLRLTARGEDKEILEKQLAPYVEKLRELVKDFLVAEEDIPLEVVIGRILKEKNKTMATAESCTGGYIAHLITTVPGASQYYKGSVVSYANEAKENILGVKHETLQAVGAVSKETVLQMVKGVIEKLNVDYAVATSGIMGPDGGSEEKPVGTVWIAVGNKDKSEAKKFYFRFERERNIEQTAMAALNMLRKFILSEP